MHKLVLFAILVALFGTPFGSYADTIYSWKDKEGNLKFSSSAPPEGVTEYKKTVSEASEIDPQAAENKRRPNFDKMVEEASQEADASRRERQERKAAEAAENKRVAEEKRQAEVQAERHRLEKQIEAIKNRAVSPTYPNGMKQAQIAELTKKIEALDESSTAIGKKAITSDSKTP